MDLGEIWCVSMQRRTDLKSHSFIMLACIGMCDAIISTWNKVSEERFQHLDESIVSTRCEQGVLALFNGYKIHHFNLLLLVLPVPPLPFHHCFCSFLI